MIQEHKIIREDRSAHSKPPTQQPPPSSGGSTASPSELAGRVLSTRKHPVPINTLINRERAWVRFMVN
jgi:hypothetical protein